MFLSSNMDDGNYQQREQQKQEQQCTGMEDLI